jgi:hypothetical protein
VGPLPGYSELNLGCNKKSPGFHLVLKMIPDLLKTKIVILAVPEEYSAHK